MKRLFTSLSGTSDGAFVIDGKHRIIFWNRAAEEILGYTAGEAIGRPCYEILGGRDEHGRTLCQRYCRMAIGADRGEVLPNQDVYARTQEGEGRWLNVTTFAYPTGDDTGERLMVHLFRDATEKQSNQQFVNQVLAASKHLQGNGGYRNISTNRKEPPGGGLTAREGEVLSLLAQGLGTGDIATRLIISPVTVRNHVQHILEKMDAHSRLEAIANAYQYGLV